MNKSVEAPELQTVSRLLPEFTQMPGGLLPLLHAVQEALGFIPASAVPLVAEAMNVSRAEVHGVITYYHFFRSKAPGKHVVQVCRAEACQACGADQLLSDMEQTLGCKLHETSADGLYSLEPVYCLGLCASSPAVQIDDKLYARMDTEQLKRVVAELGSQA
ncbi:MAG: formate dehydrogenase subunit gamma [Limnohabitans sp.]